MVLSKMIMYALNFTPKNGSPQTMLNYIKPILGKIGLAGILPERE
jgi:hypothetical protein